jgi:hypothetical protein
MSLYDDLKKIDEVEEVVTKADPIEKPILSQAVRNLPGSTLKLGKDLIDVIIHPVTSAKSILEFGRGVINLAIPGEDESEEVARAVGRYFADRYGTLDDMKETFANDPAGFLADAASVLTGGAGLLRKVPSVASKKVGVVAQQVGEAIDPVTALLNLSGQTAKATGAGVREVLGLTTGVGGEAITQAVQAGRIGGQAQQRYIENLRGQKDPADVVNRAFEALKSMGSERAARYTHGIEGLKLAEKKVNMQPIQKAIDDIVKESQFEGIPKYSKSTMAKIDELKATVSEFMENNLTHTAEGMDILKRKIDDLYPLQAQATGEARIVASLRAQVKDEILKQVPEYAEVMRPYEEAIRLEKEIARELSLGNKASAGTTLRKLQSVMRNNVNTSYGNRLELLNKLDPELLPDLSGQALSEVTPRGIQRAIGGGAAAYGTFVDPTVIYGLPLQSPRLVGEAALKTGQTQRILDTLMKPLPTVPLLRGGRIVQEATEEKQQLTPKELQGLVELEKLLQ